MSKGSNTPVPTTVLRIETSRRAGPGTPATEVAALLLTSGKIRSDADHVTRDHPAHPSGAVRHEERRHDGDHATEVFTVDLARVEDAVERIVLTTTADGGTFGQIPGLGVRVTGADGRAVAQYDHTGASVETALVLGELYRRQGGWKFRAVGQGYADGHDGLAKEYGVTARREPPRPEPGTPELRQSGPELPQPGPEPRRTPPESAARPARITLTKAAPAVSLAKQGATTGALRVNLNWLMRAGRWTKGAARNLDLDLCALYELADGRKGVVQALGNAFGALDRPPYIHLDGDDRTGASADGENLTVNLDHAADFRRILVFVTIYEGATSFAGLHATVTLRPQHGAPVDFSLDACAVPSTVCALALLTNQGGDLVVRREARYLVPERGMSPQRTVDRAYGWGMNWTPGRK
ncbi:TerD family protein [Streptomyces sp. LaPpAH-108]|uniref:TerD family protein n=1 Tax=Streptomyces sp. LaPpAH-108 TaxID=1155714 RepID=UPI0018F8B2C9|nr:TerD family protein [Streptomyces sp. LaPpAH-108]